MKRSLMIVFTMLVGIPTLLYASGPGFQTASIVVTAEVPEAITVTPLSASIILSPGETKETTHEVSNASTATLRVTLMPMITNSAGVTIEDGSVTSSPSDGDFDLLGGDSKTVTIFHHASGIVIPDTYTIEIVPKRNDP